MMHKLLIPCAAGVAFSASTLLAQESPGAVNISPDEVGWRKQCTEQADRTELRINLRPTFMIECMAGAKLDTIQNPTKQK